MAPSESFPFLTPDAAGLATLQSVFAGDPGALALLSYGPYSIAAGNPQPVPVPPSLYPNGANAGPGSETCACLEPVTDANGTTATVEEQGVTRAIALPSNDQEELARLDWQPTEKDRFFVRYFYQPAFGISPGANGIASGDWADVPSVGYSVGADWTHTFTGNFVEQLRYGFQEAKVPFEGGAFPNCVISNFGACPAQMNFTGGNDDQSFGGDANFPARPRREGDAGAEQRHMDPWQADASLWRRVRLPEHSHHRNFLLQRLRDLRNAQQPAGCARRESDPTK